MPSFKKSLMVEQFQGNYLKMKGAEKNTVIWSKIVRENYKFDCVGNCARLLTSQCSCQVLRKICIDNSTAKFISLVVQIYLAGLAIVNSFEKNCVCLLKKIMLRDTS